MAARHARLAHVDGPALALHARAGGQQCGVGAVAVAGGDDALGVDARREAAARAEQLVEREAQVHGPVDGLALLRRVLEAADERQRVAEPELAVAADMLQMQAGQAVRCPVLAEVAVATARAADAMRKHHQRHARLPRLAVRPVQAHGHGTAARGVEPVELDDLEWGGLLRAQRPRGAGRRAPRERNDAATRETGFHAVAPLADAARGKRLRQRRANHCTMSST